MMLEYHLNNICFFSNEANHYDYMKHVFNVIRFFQLDIFSRCMKNMHIDKENAMKIILYVQSYSTRVSNV